MEKENQAGAGFTAPPAVSESNGNAEVPKNGGVVTQKSATAKVAKKVRNIKVMAIDKGWFDCKRIEVGMKFNVSAEEFSEKWMQKL